MDTTKPPSLTIAVFQGSAELGNVHCNVEKMKKQLKEAKKQGADVIIFPELFTVGYDVDHDLMTQLAEKKSGKTFTVLSECAKETGIGVLYGYPELAESGRELYNSAQFIDKCGNSIANYRKTHLWIENASSVEMVFTAGNDLTNVFEFCGIKVGILICVDVEFSETVRALALKGADVVLVPTAVSTDWDIKTLSNVVVAARAFESGIHVAYINLCGGAGNYAGTSSCYGPKGKALITCGGDEEGIFLAEIKKVKTSFHMAKRRPELYKDLVDINSPSPQH